MGQRDGFSFADVSKINRMYQCDNDRREFGQNNVFNGNSNSNGNTNNNNNINNQNGFRNPFWNANGFARINELFDQYTSPSFWQGVFNNWISPQAQSRPNYGINGGYGFQ